MNANARGFMDLFLIHFNGFFPGQNVFQFHSILAFAVSFVCLK